MRSLFLQFNSKLCGTAKKLEGMNVTLERWTKNVDGVLVKNEAGQDAFWYDPQTEVLVAVDRWPVVTKASTLKENMMTEEELFSDEYFAWLKYMASKLEFDPEKIKTDVPFGVLSLEKHRIRTYYPGTAPNFTDRETAPFKRDVALGYLIKTVWNGTSIRTCLNQLIAMQFY